MLTSSRSFLGKLTFLWESELKNDRTIRYEHLDEEESEEMAAEPLPKQR
jgi:hypothetical protein